MQAIASAVPAGDFLGSDQLTKPGVLSEKLFVNPAFELALRVVGTIPPSCIPENPDEMLNRNDLRGLLEKGFYSSAANLAGKILRSYGQGFGSVGSLTKHSPDSLLLWYYRIAALVHYGEVCSKILYSNLFVSVCNLIALLYNHLLDRTAGKERFWGCSHEKLLTFTYSW